MRAVDPKHLATAFAGSAPQRCARAILFAGATGLALALTSTAGLAADQAPKSCDAFCLPVPTQDLEGQRAQGLGMDGTKVGVILWDELRQHGAPPPPPSNMGASPDTSIGIGPGHVTLASARGR